MCVCFFVFCFQAEDGIRYLVRSRGLGDVYKRQVRAYRFLAPTDAIVINYKTKTQPWSVAGGNKGVKLSLIHI